MLLLARVGLWVMMIAHTKLTYDYRGSIAGVVDTFEKSGVPLAVITGPANLFGELIGGVLLILGFAMRVIGVLMAVKKLYGEHARSSAQYRLRNFREPLDAPATGRARYRYSWMRPQPGLGT